MADSKITALTALTAADPANDMIPIVDVSDTPPASGNTKRISINNILAASGTATLASATISGDLTVATSALKVTGGQVGIGAAAPSAKLTVLDTNGIPIRFGDITAAPASQTACYVGVSTSAFSGNGNGDLILVPRTSDVRDVVVYTGSGTAAERFRVSGTGIATWSNVGGVAGTAMTLNANGLGIGVTPSAWFSGYTALQIPAGSFAGYLTATLAISQNSFFSSATSDNRYVNNGFASRYLMVSGGHQWFTAPSGTAGNNITFTQAMTLDADGILAIGTVAIGFTSSKSTYFSPVAGYWIGNHTTGTPSGDRYWGFGYGVNEVGSITQNGTTGVLYNTLSDYRLKEDVKPLSGGLTRINALKPSIYKWKTDGSNGEGFLAHELAEVVPFAVSGKKDAVNEDGSIKAQGVDLSKVVPILVAAIQELTARVQTLEAK